MGFILNIADSINLGVETIQTVEFLVDAPKSNDARTTDLAATVKITGKIITQTENGKDQTLDIALWSMVPVEQGDCYKKVQIKVTSAGKVVREYTLPNAFVVDYREDYGDEEGIGKFTLIVRQKKDKLKSTTITGGYGV